jgi:hypothetical protein
MAGVSSSSIVLKNEAEVSNQTADLCSNSGAEAPSTDQPLWNVPDTSADAGAMHRGARPSFVDSVKYTGESY